MGQSLLIESKSVCVLGPIAAFHLHESPREEVHACIYDGDKQGPMDLGALHLGDVIFLSIYDSMTLFFHRLCAELAGVAWTQTFESVLIPIDCRFKK